MLRRGLHFRAGHEDLLAASFSASHDSDNYPFRFYPHTDEPQLLNDGDRRRHNDTVSSSCKETIKIFRLEDKFLATERRLQDGLMGGLQNQTDRTQTSSR